MNRPPLSSKGPKVSRISNLMKQFETKTNREGSGEGSEGSASSSTGPSPLTSPLHNLAPPLVKPSADVSPLSGRKVDRKTSVDDLTKKFGGSTRSPSPDIKPSLPPKPPGISSCNFLDCCCACCAYVEMSSFCRCPVFSINFS